MVFSCSRSREDESTAIWGAPCHRLGLAEAFAMIAFAGSGYNYFMGYITGRSHFFIDWNSFLALGWQKFFSHKKRQPLRTSPKSRIHTTLPNKSVFKKCNGSANVSCENGCCLHLYPLWRNTSFWCFLDKTSPFVVFHVWTERNHL